MSGEHHGRAATPRMAHPELVAARLRNAAAAAAPPAASRSRPALSRASGRRAGARRAAALADRVADAALAPRWPTAGERPRVAWFSPLSARSAVGDFSRHVTEELARIADVELWTADRGPVRGSSVPVTRFDPAVPPCAADLRDHDVVVYNLGNYPPFHAPIHDASQRVPGVVILHDRVLHHMFAAKWQAEAEGEAAFAERYRSRMALHHGAGGERAAGASPPLWERPDEVVRFPLDTEALRFALGVVTHSADHATALARRWLGPLRALPLPCYRDVLAAACARRPAPAADGRVRLVSLGHVIANKNVERVVAMLAADRALAARVRYTVIGHLDPGLDLAGEVERARARAPELAVDLLGWQPDAVRDRLLAGADVFVNLRHPVMESGSASLARELAFGRPVLCFAAGSFAELPAGAVAQVPAGDFEAAAARLRTLVADAGLRMRIGERARAVAAARSEHAYAADLLDFFADVARSAPWLTAIDRAGVELGRLGLAADTAALAAAARTLALRSPDGLGARAAAGARQPDGRTGSLAAAI